MVLIHLKVSEKNQCLYTVSAASAIDDMIKQLVLVNNLRTKIDELTMYIEELLKHGPLKPQEFRGLKETESLGDEIEEKYRPPKPQMPEKVGTRFNEDPSAQRTGWILEEDVTEIILKAVQDAKDYIHIKRVDEKQETTIDELINHLDMMKGGVMIGYPAYHGLPDWEPCRLLLEEKDDILSKEDPQHESTLLWYAGKELERGKYLCEYIGKNEKTKIVCKFTKKGSGAPVREPLIDKESHSKMLAYYFKKQEEQKKLEEETDDGYLYSQWADPKGIQKNLYTGSRDISWKMK